MSEAKALTELLHLLRDDSYAITFQSTGQYRAALINEVRRKIRGLECDPIPFADEPKFHYYALAFTAGGMGASIYIGWPDLPVTLAKINEAREASLIGESSSLVSCCYLGHMTRNEMTGGES